MRNTILPRATDVSQLLPDKPFGSGETYAGTLCIADKSIPHPERDLVLEEPAQYDSKTHQYTSTSYQYIFLSGDQVTSIASVYDPSKDVGAWVVAPGEAVFKKDATE